MIEESGSVCFAIHDFNDILYTPSLTFTETAPSGNAFDDLQDAIKKVTGFNVGGSTPSASQALVAVCPPEIARTVTIAQAAATLFGTALAGIDPGKDTSGNINLVDWRTTTVKWQPVPMAYQQYEAAVSQVIADLTLPGVIDACSKDPSGIAELSAAEAVVLDVYLPARTTFSVLQSHVNSDHVVRFTSRVHATNSYTVAVQANSVQGKVAGGSVTFSLAAGQKILSTSGGFLITKVPTPSYSSVTAPISGSPATQNVLAVNNPSGASVGFAALVDMYLPNIHLDDSHKLRLNGANWGLAFSAGPTYNLANAKRIPQNSVCLPALRSTSAVSYSLPLDLT